MRPWNAIDQWKLAANWKSDEFRCRGAERGEPCACHGAILVHPHLVDFLQAFREKLNEPTFLTTAYRCDTWNVYVHGHLGSAHRLGGAGDITSTKIRSDVESWSETAAQTLFDLFGPGLWNVIGYPNNGFIHADVFEQVDPEYPVRMKFGRGPSAKITPHDWRPANG